MSEVVRIAMLEDHTLLAETLALALANEQFSVASIPIPQDRFEPLSLLPPVLAADPSIVMLDLDLGAGVDGSALITPLARSGRSVVVVTAAGDPSRWGECLALGADAVIPKSTPLGQIVAMLRDAAAGRPVIREVDRADLIQRWRGRQAVAHGQHAHLDRLTPREKQVLGALARGRRVSDIARDSYVSEATVRTQVKSILGKLDVNSQIAAVAVAHDAGWGSSG